MRQVQRIAFVLFTVLESYCVASAADMPMEAPPYIAPFSWTGFTIGGDVGGGWSSGWSSAADPLPDPTFFNASPWALVTRQAGSSVVGRSGTIGNSLRTGCSALRRIFRGPISRAAGRQGWFLGALRSRPRTWPIFSARA
jgi:hypothetical protein